MTYILAIDLGTGGPKVALVSTHGQVAGYEFEPTKLFLLDGGGAEQDPEQWWSAITTAAKRLLARDLVPREEIVAVSVTTQWSGTVAVDKAGNHLMNAIIWMDTRGAKYATKLTDGWIKIEGYGIMRLWKYIRLTGGVPQNNGKDPIGHILWLKHERPEIYEAADKFLEPKDYINLRLTGEVISSYDTIILHWVTDNRNISKLEYHPGLLKIAGVERDKLPDLVRAVDVIGEVKQSVAAELGLGAGVKVICGTPDVHSAAVGSGAVRDFETHLYVGTSSWITCHVPYKKTDPFHALASFPAAIPDRYLMVNEQETAGACLSYLRDNLFFAGDGLTGEAPDDVYERFDDLVADVPPGSEGVFFLPYLFGERTPVDDHTMRAIFFNQSLRTTRAHLIRAVYEGIAFNARWLFGYVEGFIGKKVEAMNMIGGGANSAVWCQIYADVFDRKIRKVKDPIQANVRGAGFLGALALGELTVEQIPEVVEIEKTFEPNPENRALYDKRFREFLEIYKANTKICKRLNRY